MEKKNVILSVAIAVYNEEKNLEACLSSVVSIADELVIVDGGSTDNTVEIASKYTSHIIKTDNPPIFHVNKQKALEACHGEWILQLDADEVVTTELRNEIREITKKKQQTTNMGYFIPRKNYFCGHWLRKGGQYPDYVIRLVRCRRAYFPSKSVHEQIHVEGHVGYLRSPLLHYSYSSIAEYWYKANSYISLQAQEMKKQTIGVNLASWFVYNAVKPSVTFFLLYVRHKGFLDGYWGFLFALFSSMHHPLAYWRYIRNYEENV